MTPGDRIGELTLHSSYLVGVKSRRYWRCRCSCGKITSTRQDALLSGATASCGHLQRDYALSGDARRSHGKCGTPIWHTWKSMLRRCTEENHKDYPNYGGRGITVCERWWSFDNFYADMGDKPAGRSLERVRNNMGYSPSNCVWATKTTQARNTRSTHFVELDGRRLSLAEAVEVRGLPYDTVKSRLYRGWSEYQALHTPVKFETDCKGTT